MSTTITGAGVRRVSHKTATSSGFIIGPFADTFLIIGAPLISVVIAFALYSLPASYFDVWIRSQKFDLRQIFILAFVNAHTFVMYFRSHGNLNIFRSYPFQFTVLPLTLFLLAGLSTTALGIMTLIVVWWDVYHAGMQTFGFGRIYDAKMKNDATVGRTLDWWINLLMVAGPVLSGTNFITHLDNVRDILQFMTVEGSTARDLLLHRIPDFLQTNQTYIATCMLVGGTGFLIYYVLAYYRLYQSGYHVSWQKVWLLSISSIVSIYIWGFHPLFEAFWVQNFFHSLQYFAIIGFSEHRNLAQMFRVDRFIYGSAIAIAWVVFISFLLGLWAACFASGNWAGGLLVANSVLHYWYDGFIWSVKKKQV